MSKALKITEHQLQSMFFDWVRIKRNFDTRFLLIVGIPLGGKRFRKTAIQMWKEGALKGMPDVFNFNRTSKHTGQVIEFKVGSNKMTDEQKAWFVLLKKQGWDCHEVRDFETAKKLTEEYFNT